MRQLPILCIISMATACASGGHYQGLTVRAIVETEPVTTADDAADDPSIWLHPDDPSLSLVIGTDKNMGLEVYDLAGNRLQTLPDGEMNNVDVRYGFPLNGETVDLVAAGNRTTNTMAIYRVLPSERRLLPVTAREIPLGMEVYGSCLYRSARSGKYYAFFNSKEGRVQQWELFQQGSGIDARLVRTFNAGSQTEGCVADDKNGVLYIGEEAVGIWKYSAEPDGGEERVQVDSTGPSGNLTADVEGLALFQTVNGGGHLIASSQGSSEFVVYDRDGGNDYILSFRVVDGEDIDGVTDTDGIEVISTGLGGAFAHGLFVAQDGSNDGGAQNFKYVAWTDIVALAPDELEVEPDWDPRATD